MRKLAIALTTIALGFLAPILLMEFFLRFLPVSTGMGGQAVNSSTPVAGFEPLRDFTYSKGWNFALVNRGHINNYGFVNDQDYDPTQSTPLLAVVGDSYVEAAGWQSRLEAGEGCTASGRPDRR